MARTVLPNCCENWILDQGGYYELGKSFTILPCGHSWRKEDRGKFRQFKEGSSTLWKILFRKGFPYLDPEGVDPPILSRCCSTILIEYGSQIDPKQLPLRFSCPVCDTPWVIEESKFHEFRQYRNESTQQAFRLREEDNPPFLEPVSQDTLVT